MAVKASATITLTQYRDTKSVTRYYKLQPAGSSAPLKPETKPPSSDWTDSEPACDISKELYFCDLTIFSNGEGEYSKVSKSTSYEAAKQAYNKAQAAKDGLDNLEIGGRNLLIGSEKGVVNTNADTSSYADIKLQAYNGSTYVGQEFSFGVTAGEHIEYTYTSKYSGNNIRIGDNGSAHDAVNTFLVPEYKEGVVYTFSCDVIDDRPNVVGGYVLKNIKLEKGNKATDWTPAPEDVDAGISNVDSKIDDVTGNIYAPGSTLLDGSKINDGSLSINQMDDTVAGTYSDPTTKRGTMEWKDDALHIKSVDSNAQNTYETVIGGDGIKFNWNGTETASIDQDELRINKTVVINAMEVGNWSWAIHPTTGNLMVKWNGGK